ncbi:MAG: beta-L-arabinofuranosidase domain-containing protein [Pirellulaceae bacterium]
MQSKMTFGRDRLARFSRQPRVVRTVLLLGTSLSLAVATGVGDEVSVVSMTHASPQTRNAYYAGYREPLRSTPLVELPVGAVRPQGWLRKQLTLQAAGFHGQLGEISRFLLKEGNAWLSPTGAGDHGWEEVPYWLKGYILTAYLLDDPVLVQEAHVWIKGALDSLQEDGWFGPAEARSTVGSTKGKYDLWPNMVMLFCLQAYYERTQDERVLDLMKKYFRFELGIPDHEFLPPYWQQQRAADNLYSVYWLYNRIGEAWLLELADKIHRHTANWTDGVPNWHNVNMSQAFGGPTVYYLQSGDAKHLFASYRNYDEFRSRYGQVPGGMFGSDENCRDGFVDPRQAIETCGMVEMMHSQEKLVNITGDLLWADRCEDVAFNSLPAALTADLRALRYLTSPNQILSDAASKSPGVQNSGPMFLMDPTSHRCCQHNVGHGWPYFVMHLWSATSDNGLAAVMYGPSEVEARIGDGTTVTIREETRYPFSEQIKLSISLPQATAFPLYLRIPGWCTSARVSVNGTLLAVPAEPGKFVRIARKWQAGDTIEIMLPMSITLRKWEANQNSVSVDRGPLTYSLRIGEKYVPRKTSLAAWPACEIHPTTPWNYGLVVDEQSPATSFEIVQRDWPPSDMPFTLDGVPLELVGFGKRIPEWEMDELGLVGLLQPSPVKSDQPTEKITLVPMGAARLRISSFPVIGEGPEAHLWKKSPAARYRSSASHCCERDTLRALSDEIVPKNSIDQGIPRMTWWDHKGTAEWVQYEFSDPRQVSGVGVYWFEDAATGGGCRVPASWSLEYRVADGSWQEVAGATEGGVAKDTFNEVTFAPLEATGLRLNVQLQQQASGGILEWQVH